MPQNFTSTEASGFAPPPYQPLRPSDIAKVKKSYDIATKPKFAKTTSDTTIYDFATSTVINWWKKQQKPSATPPPAGGSTGGGSTGGSAGSGSGGAGAGTSTPSATDTQAKAREGGGQTGGATSGTVPKPSQQKGSGTVAKKPVTPKQAFDMLKAAGHLEWKPPTYALSSIEEFEAWIARAEAATAAARKSAGSVIGKPPSIGKTSGGFQKY